ncbi:MAG: sigma-70 family RNA polymerase sigma factor [Acetobacteraceae bacterium]|nr:sigma-70 family RNA polymerase sigma factor [Acetobacteraceae bacterium]MBV8524823.1 sigma-70 family RNA polymerase sigma factor [Acetobacteraceae bacterium]MBV8590658.1 sigma-70 family RNA polymerase sigma factor [Acetobacteraceae bacterium]
MRREIAALLPRARAFARFLVKNRAEADDLVQEGLVRALASLDQFRPGTRLRPWLFTILRNTFYEQARRRRTERRVMEEVARDAPTAKHPTQTAPQENEATLNDLQRLLWTLPPLLREALVLVGAQGLAHEEAAEICNVPVGTMRARVSRARAAIARAMRARTID